jgi:hypothetical protein
LKRTQVQGIKQRVHDVAARAHIAAALPNGWCVNTDKTVDRHNDRLGDVVGAAW